MTQLLSKDHRILEKGLMQYRPFGLSPTGHKIRDVSGVTVRANVAYLEDSIARDKGPRAGTLAVQELCRLLNERIADSAYHVTPGFLDNVWNSYSYEFVMFLGEFCATLSGDPCFHFNVGKEKFLSPLIQTLGRSFSVAQIYRMFPHFGQKFAKGSIEFAVGRVTGRSAILRMKYTDEVYEQFGAYRQRCAQVVCHSSKAGLAAVPHLIHGMRPAHVRDLTCIADGDEYCEWEFTWDALRPVWSLSVVVLGLLGLASVAYLYAQHPDVNLGEALVIALFPAAAFGLANRWQQHRDVARQQLIEEQLRSLEAQHEQLREAYLEIEGLNAGLEARVLDRTAALETVNQELGRLNAELKELNHLKSAFVSIVSHELRTPLTSIKGYVENILDGLTGPLNDKQSNYLSRMKHNVERLARMVDDLLDLSRIETGRMELDLRCHHPDDIVAEVIEEFRPLARAKGVRLSEPPARGQAKVLVDGDKLHQVLTNLMHNAIKFTPPEGHVVVEFGPDDHGFMRFFVADSGVGIPKDESARIFEKFYRGEAVPLEARGAGLGLAISKTLVELHGGQIWVENTESSGSRFGFTIPLADTVARPVTSQPGVASRISS